MALNISPLSPALGAEVTGVDLSSPLEADQLTAIENALRDHLVLVIRDQHLDPAQLLAAVRLFGETMEQHLTGVLMKEHPEIAVLDSRSMPPDKAGKVIPFGARMWHTDHTNHLRPPKLTALYALALPATGGDTSFANMHTAYESLDSGRQNHLDGLSTVNAIEDYAYISSEAREKFGQLPVHPLVRTHPDTGRKAVYVHPGKTKNIVGMEPDASQEFIDHLLDEVITPANTYRHQWRLGDLLLCDNRAVLHRAHRDYDMSEGRIMHRVILRGEVPA